MVLLRCCCSSTSFAQFRLRLMRYLFIIINVLGKQMYVADTLSRAPVEPANPNADHLDEVEAFTHATVASLPPSSQRLLDILLRVLMPIVARQIVILLSVLRRAALS